MLAEGGALGDALGAALPSGWSLRERVEADGPFLCQLYASTRWEELTPVPWPEEHKLAFLADQFAKQHTHYLQHYPGAYWLVIEVDGVSVGRVYLYPTEKEIRLMDIALVPERRDQGVGTALLQALAAQADAGGRIVSLHVEPNNRALGLYRRLGYAEIEARGYYLYLERRPRPDGASTGPS